MKQSSFFSFEKKKVAKARIKKRRKGAAFCVRGDSNREGGEALAMPICERTLWALDLFQCQNNIDDRLNIYKQGRRWRVPNRLVVFLILFIYVIVRCEISLSCLSTFSQ